MKFNNFSQSFDRTLDYYAIKGKTLSERTGVSQNHISEFKNGGNISAISLSKLMEAMEELAPGSKLYFCLLLAGEEPTEFLSNQPNQPNQPRSSLRSLIKTASPQEKAEALKLITSWVVESCAHGEPEQQLEAV